MSGRSAVGEEAQRAGPRHKELVIEVARMSQVDGSGLEKTRRLHAAFHALPEDGAAAEELTTQHDVPILTEMVVGTFVAILLNWQSVEGYPVREQGTSPRRSSIAPPRRSSTTRS